MKETGAGGKPPNDDVAASQRVVSKEDIQRIASVIASCCPPTRQLDKVLCRMARNDEANAMTSDSALHEALFDSLQEGLIVVDGTGTIVNVNHSAEIMFGYAAGTMQGMPVESLVPLRYRGTHPALRVGFIAEGMPRPMGAGRELRATRGDGSEFAVAVSLTPMKVDGVLFTTALVSDLSQPLAFAKAKSNNRSNVNYLDLLESNVQDYAIIILDATGHVIRWNHGAERIKGYTSAEIIGRSFSCLYSPEDVAAGEPMRHLRQAAESRHASFPGWRIRRDGSKFWADATLTALYDGQGMLLGFSMITKDATERKRVESERQVLQQELQRKADDLARSNAELEQFAYSASHDLQEPLRMVSSYCDLLRRRYQGKLDAEADEFIDFAVDGARRMQTMIQNLMAYSRVSSHRPPPQRVDLNAALDEASKNLVSLTTESGAVVTWEALPEITGSAAQIVTLLQNLVANAIHYRSAESPRIHVSASRKDSAWEISVRDNGIGVAAEDREHIFQIFHRASPPDTTHRGTGLGLALCRRIVEVHGGRIGVESTPGRGSTFTFSIPDGGGATS